ncbi:MAG: type III toxin-antitoxin system ToxN/AbiQ family toxin [Firmicutes bacterium]|nr:type III toxin-antitoxin system ToxN/AbiQ family toxin [Bacillota bacterium]
MKNYSSLKIVLIDQKYCDYLRKFDNKVPYNMNKKNNRPFVGILFNVNNHNYFAPLSSPKKKHLHMKNNLDFYKIDNGVLGVVNFNNMIPVNDKCFTIIDFRKKIKDLNDQKYLLMLKKQYKYLNKHKKELRKKSKLLYNLYCSNKLTKNIINRCCNFKLLEEKSVMYN